MGTDELSLNLKENARIDRAGLRKLIVDVWTARGAKLAGTKWTAKDVWKDDDQDRFAYAIAPATKRGWVTVVESAEYSTSVDAELARKVAALTTVWVHWSFDHAAMYGVKRLSKQKDAPVDVGGIPYARMKDEAEWEFLSFRGVCPTKYERWAPTEKTKSDVLPKDPTAALHSKLGDAVRMLEVDEAVDIVRRLGEDLDESSISQVFDPSYPIEWEETAEGVAVIGSAMADVVPLDAACWARLLEVAAVRDDAKLAARAAASLTTCKPKDVKRAVAEANERFAARKNAAATKRFAKWLERR